MDLDFEQVVNAQYESLYRFALSLTRNESEASDLTQDTFYTFASKSHQVRDKSKIKTWLFTTLHRKFLGARRHDTRFPHVEISQADHDLPVVSPVLVERMDSTLVWDALLVLDELYRTPLMLFYLEEHSYKEIADTLDIPLGTVMSRISRGKMLLRDQLSKAEKRRTIVPLPQDGKISSQ